MTQRVRKLLMIAAASWLVVTLFVVFISPFSAWSVQDRLALNAEEALERRGLDWVQVEMRGQHAVLSGAAPSDDARADARAIVLASSWSGGVVAGGITGVTDNMTNARLERSFAFRADVAVPGRVLVRGDATDAEARRGIARFASDNFANGADTDLTLAPGGAASADWEEAAKRLLGQLARLDRGAVFLEGDQAGLIGEAPNPQVARSIATALETLPEPYRAAVVITPAGAPAVVSIEDQAGCRAAIRAAHGTDDLRFDREAASASPMTETALRRMARVFGACPDNLSLHVRIAIADGGVPLAADRIETVQSLLNAGGVAAERLDIAHATDAVELISFEIEEIEE